MKKKTRQPKSTPARTYRVWPAAATCCALAGVGIGALLWQRKPAAPDANYTPKPAGEITFSKDIAPIVFQNCSGCHRPGQSAPFPLLDYGDVKKRAADIAGVTKSRLMPPWLPEPGHGSFSNERRLSVNQIGLLQQWVQEGAVEGNPADLPPLPKWSGEWQLGSPDLVVTMPSAYELPADGRDVYRNFVIPVSIDGPKFVRATELRPGNSKIVHHAFVKIDRTAQSRRLDAQDAEPGFPGMNAPAEMPDGHMLGWQPGRTPTEGPPGLAWRLDPGADLVLQTHLNPSGKPEHLQASIGLYFTDQPPTNTCFKMTLASFVIDIPPGEQNYVAEDSFKIPVDLQILAVLPHAHYLAREMRGWATLPDGRREELLWIKQWNFDWQGDYRYSQPVSLPAGSTLSMRYTFDNSANNPRNPNRPPKPVGYGSQSSDEMAELWFQVLPRNREDLAALDRAYEAKMSRKIKESDEFALRKNPNDPDAHVGVGQSFYEAKKLDDAARHFRAAILLRPAHVPAHYNLGLLFRRQGNLAEARQSFETVLRLDPSHARAHGNLGFVFLTAGDLEAARSHFDSALNLNPDDGVAQDGLRKVLKALGR